jgi:ABC-2 type transport system ATP-binding protein
MGIAVQVSGVTKQYAKAPKPAIANLSFSIEQGTVFGLLGPNGAGKSTLVGMLSGLLKPDQGNITVLGIDPITNGASVRKKMGVAPQEIALYPTLTAFENLWYFSKMYGLQSSDCKQRIEDYLHTFGLTSKKDKQVHTFSGGMKRRLNLIAALLHQPEIIMLDEPTSGVDVQSRGMILEFLSELTKTQVTILYSSHYLEEAEKICSDILIIDEGVMLAEGSPSALLKSHEGTKNLEEVFIKLTGKKIRD